MRPAHASRAARDRFSRRFGEPTRPVSTRRERRHVVVEHEAFAVLAFERVDVLFVALGAERRDDSACVSPRVNSAEPCVRGSTPVRISIGRTVRVSRPSMRGSPFRIWLRTIFASMSNSTLPTVALSAAVVPAAGSVFFQFRGSPGVHVLQLCRTRLLVADLISGEQIGLREFRHTGDQRLVFAAGCQSHSALPPSRTRS